MNLNILKRPMSTEKSTVALSLGKYTFEVDPRAKKIEIAKAIEKTFGVHVKGIQTIVAKGKKKAIVNLTKGEKIDIFELPTEK